MKQGSNTRRSRSRGGNKRHSGGKNNSFESNGPEVKIRGSAQQVQEKYLALARDANVSGDRVAAEAFFQFAEHYYRIANGDGAGKGQNRGGRDNKQQSGPAPAGAKPQGEAEVIDTTARVLAAATEPEKDPDAQPAAEAPADPGTEPAA